MCMKLKTIYQNKVDEDTRKVISSFVKLSVLTGAISGLCPASPYSGTYGPANAKNKTKEVPVYQRPSPAILPYEIFLEEPSPKRPALV